MLNYNLKQVIKAAIKSLIVAFVYLILFFSIGYILFKDKINNVASVISLISSNTNKEILKDVKINLESKRLEEYPNYGTRYGEIRIPSLNIKQPVYFGDSLSILKKGVGHSNGSYFPGEGGAILMAGHNNRGILSNLKNAQNGMEVYVDTTYGHFKYVIYNHQVINYMELDKVPIQKEEEILMVYTCYQSLTIGHTKKRFVIYARLESAEYI